MSEGEVTPDESEKASLKESVGGAKVIQVSSKEDDNASVHSRASKAQSVGKTSVKSHGSKAMSAGKGVASPKHSSRAASVRDDDTLTEKSHPRTDHTEDGEYEDEFDSDSDGEF